MANPAAAATAPRGKYLIHHSFSIDGGTIELQLDTTRNPAVVNSILKNLPLPPGDQPLGAIAVGTPDKKPVKLGHKDGGLSVDFGFTGHFCYEMAAFSSPSATLTALSPSHDIAAGVKLTGAAGDRFMLLRLGYDIGATAKGSVALGAGLSAIFSGSGAHSGEWGIIHRFGSEGADDVLRATFDSWILPSQFDGPNRLAPGTWMLAEVDGSFSLNVGIQAGHEFSWVRALPDGMLKGDVGLRVALAATAVLGFSASGDYAVALSRPDDTRKIGLSVYKLAKRGASFTVNAEAGAGAVLPAALEKSKDPMALIQAIFGTHFSQLVDDLSLARAAALGKQPTDQAAQFLISLGKRELAAAGLADSEYYNQGLIAADALVKASTGAGATLTSLLASLASKGLDAGLAPLTATLKRIRAAGLDTDAIAGIIKEQLARVDFFQSPFGRWLAAVVRTTPHAALLDSEQLHAVSKSATNTLAMIGGAAFQALIEYARTKLDLGILGKPGPAPAFSSLDGWLQQKLAGLLGKAIPDVVEADISSLQTAVRGLIEKSDAFYASAMKAARTKAAASLKASYQSSTTKTALIDVVFDFDANPDLLPHLQAAIAGHFEEILLNPEIPGITLQNALLTHGLERQQHVEFNMPFFDASRDNITRSLASLAPHDDGQGRVLAYDVDASSDVSAHVRRRSQRDSTLTLALSTDVPLPGVHIHPGFHASLGYALRSASAQTTRAQLQQTLGPLVETYRSQLLPPPADFNAWLDNLEQGLGGAGTRNLGPSLTTLDISVPGQALAIWLGAPADRRHPVYSQLSLVLQRRLRQLIYAVYFSNPQRFDTPASAYPLIAYHSLQAFNSFDTTQDAAPPVIPTRDDYYWNCADLQHIRAVMGTFTTRQNIADSLADAHSRLASLGLDGARFYTPDCVAAVQSMALKRSDGAPLPALLSCLLFAESRTIRGVVHAACEAAAFGSNSTSDPRKALASLSGFGADLVDAFHGMQSDQPFTADELTMLGSAMFCEATLALANGLGGPEALTPAADLSLTFFHPDRALTPDRLVAGDFKPADVRLPQALPPA